MEAHGSGPRAVGCCVLVCFVLESIFPFFPHTGREKCRMGICIGVTESQNSWVGKGMKDHHVPTPTKSPGISRSASCFEVSHRAGGES